MSTTPATPSTDTLCDLTYRLCLLYTGTGGTEDLQDRAIALVNAYTAAKDAQIDALRAGRELLKQAGKRWLDERDEARAEVARLRAGLTTLATGKPHIAEDLDWREEYQMAQAYAADLLAEKESAEQTYCDRLAAKDAQIATLRTALMDTSCFWQAVAAHYGPDHLCKDAEERAIRVRDAALEAAT